MDEVSTLTRELVAIPSHDDETAAGDYIQKWLRAETDAAVTRDAVGNVIARRQAPGTDGNERDAAVRDDRDALALVGHHDVVAPDDSQLRDGEYVLEEREGRLYGRGTADMKGAVAAAMLAFRDADLDGGRGQTDGSNAAPTADDLVFASFVGEEVGGDGARAAIEDGFAPTYAIVGEGSTDYSAPGVTDVAVAHKGRRASTVLARGTSVHASEADAGENAIYRACDAVAVVRDLSVPAVEVAGDLLEGSVVVTGIDGGSAWNVVPDACEVTIDERTVPGERAPLARVEAIDGVEWRIDQDLPPMRCTDEAFAEAVLAAARGVQAGGDVRPSLVTKPHATDAGWLDDRAGTQCVVCGASEPGEAHTADESVSLSVLERCYRIYRQAAESIVGA